MMTDDQEFRIARLRLWTAMLRRTVPALALATIVALLAAWGAAQEATYVAVAMASGYAAASYKPAKNP